MKWIAILAAAAGAAFGITATAESVVMQGFNDGSRVTLNPACASVSADGKTLTLDSMNSPGEWNWAFKTAPGVLQPETNYLATFEYRVEEPELKKKFLHFICRPLSVNDSSLDTLRHNEGTSAKFQPVKLKFFTGDEKNTPALQLHLFQQLKGEIRNFVLTETGRNVREFVSISADPKPFTGEIAPLPTGAKEFEVELPRNSGKAEVNAADFGVAESNPDNTPALNKALEHCRQSSAARLKLAKGTYRMTSDRAITLDGMRDFEFDGGGSTFVFQRKRDSAFALLNCERTWLHNFKIDWDWERDPLASIVEVVRADDKSADFRFLNYKRFPRRDLRVAILSSYDPVVKAVGIEGGLTKAFEFYAGKSRPETEWLDDNTLRITASGMNAFKPGQLFRMQHYYYDLHGFVMNDNRHLTLEDIDVLSTPGHAFVVGGKQQYWQFRRVRIAPPPGDPRRVITCTADHCHIARSRGFFKMEECEFSLGADDCLNAHDNTVFAEKTGPYTLRTRNARKNLFQAGEHIELRHGDYSPAAQLGAIKELKTVAEKGGIYELTFEKPIPEPLKDEAGFVLFDTDYGTRNVIVRNCYFHSNRARAILILAHDVTIENNRFFHNEQGGIKIETGYTFNVWSEGYGSGNIVIRGNTFDTVNPLGVGNDGMARDIYIGVYMKTDPSTERTTYPILSNILFENNTFRNTFGLVAFISSADNVTFRNNTFENPTARKKPLPYRGCFYVTCSGRVNIVNNRYLESPNVPNPGVTFTPDSVKKLTVQGNTVSR